MRIKSIVLHQHPVIGDLSYDNFDLQTEKKDIATFFVGANGTGKSFFLESLVEIFQFIENKTKIQFGFELIIEDKKDTLKVTGKKNEKSVSFQLSNKSRTKEEFLPNNILFYYSGETKRAQKYFIDNYLKYRTEIINGTKVSLPPFFYIDPSLISLILLTLQVYEPIFSKSDIWKHLKIDYVDKVELEFLEQDWYKNNMLKFDDANPKFWGARGELSDFCNLLLASSELITTKPATIKNKNKVIIEEYDFISSLQINPKDFSIIRDKYSSPKTFFELLVNLNASGLLGQKKILIRKNDSKKIFDANNLSEGEKQLLLVLGFIELTQNDKTLFLIDEPDTHLNPLWKYEYLRNLQAIVKTQPEKIELFVCTHDPLLISGLEAENVIVISKEKDKMKFSKAHEDLLGKGVEIILTSELFGLNTTLDYETDNKFSRRRKLLSKALIDKLNPEEAKELAELTKLLQDVDFTLPLNDPMFLKYLSEQSDEKFVSSQRAFNTDKDIEYRRKLKKYLNPDDTN